MRVWIDLSNSPHPLLFAPISRRLTELGHEVLVTARDNAQTVELARERWPTVEVIGGSSPRPRAGKVAILGERVRRLMRWARANRPDVALSHNSYAQILAARLSGTRVVTAMDFEYQPANHLAFRLAHVILVPEAVSQEVIGRQGASDSKLRRYRGLKEEVYLGDFEPNSDVFGALEIREGDGTILVVARTPPSKAAYHRFDNPLFLEALKAVGSQPEVRLVVLLRHPEERRSIEALQLRNCTIPGRAIDSRSLMYRADLVIGAGGTMTREAALLGVPTVSVFAGAVPGVDRWLEDRGALRRLTKGDQMESAVPRPKEPHTVEELRERAHAVMQVFVDAVVGRL
jgi:predicted glycosyltransferase